MQQYCVLHDGHSSPAAAATAPAAVAPTSATTNASTISRDASEAAAAAPNPIKGRHDDIFEFFVDRSSCRSGTINYPIGCDCGSKLLETKVSQFPPTTGNGNDQLGSISVDIDAAAKVCATVRALQFRAQRQRGQADDKVHSQCLAADGGRPGNGESIADAESAAAAGPEDVRADFQVRRDH